MNTSEYHSERKRVPARPGVLVGIGMAIGFVLGFGSTLATHTSGYLPAWALCLVAYGLGAVSLLTVWWLMGYEVSRKSGKSSVRE